MNIKGLVIRYFGGGYYLCDGKPMEGHENDGELWVGNAVKWFETWDEADAMRKMIDAAYGMESNSAAPRSSGARKRGRQMTTVLHDLNDMNLYEALATSGYTRQINSKAALLEGAGSPIFDNRVNNSTVFKKSGKLYRLDGVDMHDGKLQVYMLDVTELLK